MRQVHLLGANRSYDRDEQTVAINQIVVLKGYSGGSYVVYDITRNQWGITYHLIQTETYAFHTSELIRPLSDKFGIGIYYDDKDPQFLDPMETAILLTKANEKKAEEEQKVKTEREERNRIAGIGAERLRCLIPQDAKAVIVGKLQHNESDSQRDYFDYSTSRTVILGFSTHQRNIFAEMRKVAGNFEGTAYLAEPNEDYENREAWSMGHGYYLGASKYSGWIIEKDPFGDRERFIENYAYTAGNEENIRLKVSCMEEKTGEISASEELVNLNLEIVEYSEKAIAVFGDTKPIKDVLKGLNGLFRANLTHKGERRAGWIYSKKQEEKVREVLTRCNASV